MVNTAHAQKCDVCVTTVVLYTCLTETGLSNVEVGSPCRGEEEGEQEGCELTGSVV